MNNAFVAGLPRSTQVNSLMFYELYLIYMCVFIYIYYIQWCENYYIQCFFFFVMFDCWYDVLFMKCCVGFTSDVTGHTFQKVKLLSHQSTEYLPKSLWDNQDIFWQMWDEPLCSFWSAVAFALELSHECHFCPVSFLLLNHEQDLNWGKWGLQFFRCCSGFFYDLLDESSLRSWSNFGRLATPGKVHHCSKFSPFVDNGSDRGSPESQSLRNGFITLSRLTRQLFCFSPVLEFL